MSGDLKNRDSNLQLDTSLIETFPYNVAPYFESFTNEYMCALEIIVFDRPGVLSRITQEIFRLGGDLSFLVASDNVDGKLAFFMVVRGSNRMKLTREELVSKLKLLDDVIDVRVIPPLKKIVFSRSLYPPTISGVPTINLTINNLAEIHKDLIATYGILNTELVMIGIAKAVGRALGKIAKRQNFETIQELMEYLKALYLVSGRGYISSYLVTERMIRIDFQFLAEKKIVDEINLTAKQKTKLVFEPEFLKQFLTTAANIQVTSIDMIPKKEQLTAIIRIKR